MQSACFLLSSEYLAVRSLHSLVVLTLRLCRDIRDKLRINKPVKCTPSRRPGNTNLKTNIRLLLQNNYFTYYSRYSPNKWCSLALRCYSRLLCLHEDHFTVMNKEIVIWHH